MRNPYEVLGVPTGAAQDEIKNAYRKLAKKNHPDLNPGNKKSEEAFKEIAAAYELIGSPENRQKFDRGESDEQVRAEAQSRQYYSQTQRGPGARYSSTQGMDDDLFESLFGGRRASGGRGTRGFAMPGEDLVYQMDVEFKDAILGAEKTFTLPSGKTLQTKIPPNFKNGQKLRFAGQGSPGQGGASSGDLYIEIRVKPSDSFTRNEQNIESRLDIPFVDALLGGQVSAPTLDGPVVLKIPKHSNSGTRLRIRGKGVPSPGGARGDQIVTLRIRLPENPDERLEALVREWSGRNEASEAGGTKP